MLRPCRQPLCLLCAQRLRLHQVPFGTVYAPNMAPGLATFLAADLAFNLVPDLAPDPLPDLVQDVAPDFVPVRANSVRDVVPA